MEHSINTSTDLSKWGCVT